jgi:transcriptional regulator with GAF, ATPase, and Fis domain
MLVRVRVYGAGGDERGEVLTALRDAGLRPRLAGPGDVEDPALVIARRADEAACELVRRLTEGRSGPVLIIGHPGAELRSEDGWRLLASGAADVLPWSAQHAAQAAAARLERWRAVDELVGSPLVQSNLVGRSTAWRSVVREVIEVARFTDSSVLVTGESGTGKELVARAIHRLDPRPAKGDLVVLDCTTVVPALSGSEFFGHERGAFTGAVAARPGAFELADGGTLFLDEVGELPLPLQAELMRVVQEGTYKRVGGNAWRRTTFRLVCATNRDLVAEGGRGAFRRDFYYRIAAWRCHLPSLRERPEDVIPLAEHFLAERFGRAAPPLDPAVKALLVAREYPGNVRDLRHLSARIAARHVGPGPITIGDVPEEEWPLGPRSRADWRDGGFEAGIRRALATGATLREISAAAKDTAVALAVDDESGNLRRAASRLGVSQRALQLRRAARPASAEAAPGPGP